MYYVEGIPSRKLIKIAVKGTVNLEQILKIAEEILKIKEKDMPDSHKAWIFIADEINLPTTKELQAIDLTITRSKLFGLQKVAIQLPPNASIMQEITAQMLSSLYLKLSIPVKIVDNNYDAEDYLDNKWKE